MDHPGTWGKERYHVLLVACGSMIGGPLSVPGSFIRRQCDNDRAMPSAKDHLPPKSALPAEFKRRAVLFHVQPCGK